MKEFFSKLTPAERRLVVFVGIGVFVVINIWFIIPMFGEYGKYQEQRVKAQRLVETYKAEIQKGDGYKAKIRELSKQGGEVPTETAALRLSQEVSSQAALSGVTLPTINPMTRGPAGNKTNAFFEEATITVNFNSGEKELLDFLYRLADKDLLIRAKSMQLQPDIPGRMRLQGTLTLVKSYQRPTPPKAKVTGATTTAPTAANPKPVAAKPTNAPAPANKPPPSKPVPTSNTATNKKK